jgi:hypothetical protein
LKIQLWTALIAMLPLKIMRFRSSFNGSLSNLVAVLPLNLFTYRDLWKWLNAPLRDAGYRTGLQQLKLNFG